MSEATLQPDARTDLYRHVNGQWLDSYVIPADRPMDGAFIQLRESSRERCRDIIAEAAAGSIEGREAAMIGQLYAAFMDEAAIEEAGTAPVAPDLALIDAATSHAELAEVAGRLERQGSGTWFGFYVGIDPHHPDDNCIHISQAGLSLPDECYYREDHYESIRRAFSDYVGRAAQLWQTADAPSWPERVMGFEKALAAHHMDSVSARDADKTTNITSWDSIVADCPGFDWERWRAACGLPEGNQLGRINVASPAYLKQGAQVWANTDLETLKSWMRFNVASGWAGLLGRNFVDTNFDFYGRTLAGTEQLPERWKRGVDNIESWMGMALGRLYVARHFPPAAKAQVEALVDNLLRAYRDSISALEWMTDATRQAALTKLNLFTPKIGYPAKWRDYSKLDLDGATTLIDMVRRVSEFHHQRQLAKIGKKVDRDEWLMTPQTVNAYYYPAANEIVFPAAILQPPFFDPQADPARNYGGIGAVIGHEIGHGFDDQGSKYDGHGRLENWWSQVDREQFTARTKALIGQYDALVPAGMEPSQHVNGALTIGENIGDLGGCSIALKAFRIAAGGRLDDQQVRDFFYSWARIWRTAIRKEMAAQLLAIDPHSPAEFRCNQVVRNIDEFHTAFATSPADALWLDPDQRVSIW